MTALAIAAAIAAAYLALVAYVLWAAWSFAELGFEDADGFHTGEPAFTAPNPSQPDREDAGEDHCEGEGFDARHSGSNRIQERHNHG